MQTTEAGLERLASEYLQEPHAVHERLREVGPVSELVLPRGLKVWVVTRYDEARIALSDNRFSKDFSNSGDIFARHLQPDAAHREFEQSFASHMLNTDPPAHNRLRKLVNKAFTARRMEALRPRVQEITDQLLDEMEGKSEVDLLDALAFPLPITVICELLDVPLDQRDEFRTWSGTLLTDSAPEEADAAAAAMYAFLAALVESKRANPGDDIFSALVHANDDDDRLDETELISMAFLLLVAGHETTVNLIGNGVLALLRNPDQLAALRADRSLLPGAVEEFLRLDGPINLATFRYSLEEVELGGVTIPAGEIVLVSLLGANRDPEKFPEPDRMDITRPTGGHVAFGHGVHFCLGAPLARLEGAIAVGSLLDRFDIELAGEPETLRWRESTLLHGLEKFPVSLSDRGPR
ncbi:cytochrome P450 [Umezawaea sp. Da 62-37]|uniref:cytochrome P450 family protein n=1 Tax=Umezawaea sp. Da 62-37 TaxID=3075927 RepID=UPI0028F726F5|nr:cytochrome P450 [Umezawaea sp. Da 62-37]WNV89702.1 cytochrome P450 [Umezawaea sp. Da 62-37]